MNSIYAILDTLKSNKVLSAFVGIFLFTLLAFSNNPRAMDIFPKDWKDPMKTVFDSIKWGIISYGAYLSLRDPSTNKIEKSLREIQKKPGQRVLPPKELLDSDIVSTIKELKTNSNDSKKV